MEGKLIKNTAGEYYLIILHRNLPGWFNVALELSDGYYAIASSHHIDDVEELHKLSLTNCQAIERGYDLDELAEKCSIDWNGEIMESSCGIYKEGFQKALEILGNKKFTEEDMRTAYDDGACNIDRDGCPIDDPDIDSKDTLQSIQQNELDVVIEMEYMYDCGSSMCRNGCQSMDKFGEGCSGHSSAPKLDNEGRLILKRKK